MASFNRVVLLGNLTRDPELRYIPSGTAVTDIGLAINDRRKGPNGDWVEETTFVDVTLWGRTAEVASEYLSKGSSVLIEGRLKLDTWEKTARRIPSSASSAKKCKWSAARGAVAEGAAASVRVLLDRQAVQHRPTTTPSTASQRARTSRPMTTFPFRYLSTATICGRLNGLFKQ